jgi:hypothetical protein
MNIFDAVMGLDGILSAPGADSTKSGVDATCNIFHIIRSG